MKKILFVSAIVATCMSPCAFAQMSSSFQGFYGQIGIGGDNHRIENNNLVTPATGTRAGVTVDTLNESKASAKIDLGYGFDVNNTFFFGIGVEFNPATQNLGTTNLRAADNSVLLSNNAKVKEKYALYVAPGYKLDASSAVYGKIGYASEKINTYSTVTGGDTLNATLDGWMVGLGYKRFANANLYWFGELTYMDVNKNGVTTTGNTLRGDVKDKSYGLFVGAGYKF